MFPVTYFPLTSPGKNYPPAFLCYDTGRIENDGSNNYSVVECVIFAAVTFLPSLCLANKGKLHRHINRWEGFKNYVVELSSGAMISIANYITIQNVVKGIRRNRENEEYISLLQKRTLKVPPVAQTQLHCRFSYCNGYSNTSCMR
jgi:hypothetical protein